MISKDKVVSMKYALKNDKGEVLEESGDETLDYLHGYQNIVIGLEEALEGLIIGSKKSIEVDASKGYGQPDEKLKMAVPKANFQGDLPPVGKMVAFNTPEGEYPVMVVSIEDDHINVDANHPMAGKTLYFDIEITDIRDATDDEKAHGHVHQAGGCGHDH